MKITIVDFSLVLLIGVSGSGKSTFAKKHFSDELIFSTETTFEELETGLKEQLAQGLSVVIELSFFFEQHRNRLLALAKNYGARPYAIVFKLPTPLLRQRNAKELPLSIGKQVEYLNRIIGAIPNEGFTNIYLLDGIKAIETSDLIINHELDWQWSEAVSKRYQDYGRPASQPSYEDDYDYLDADLDYAENLVLEKKANPNITRTALPMVLKALLGDSGSTISFLLTSSKDWLEDEREHLKAYWFSLWHFLLRDKGAFERWDSYMPASNFINNIDNPEPFLAIWQRDLIKMEKPALRHLVNTILDAESLCPELLDWLKQSIIQQILEKAFFQYQNTEFGQRISQAEDKLKAIKRQTSYDNNHNP